MNYIFKSNFYTVYRAPNADELINKINTYTDDSIDNAHFTWGNKSRSDKIPLKWKDYMELLLPSIRLFGEEFNVRFNFTLYDPWINFYKRGDHQEVHVHAPHHLSGVFMANDGEEFSQFYFIDKEFPTLYSMRKIIDHHGTYNVELKPGDIMFFPSYMLHGVSPHRSDIIRKSLSFNLDFINLEKL
jgi:ribosomal protein L16 Arg81 hydroxylase